MNHFAALKEAKELADFIFSKDEEQYPAFRSQSDARECAMLLREQTGGQAYYAYEGGEDLQGKFWYVA